MKLGIIGGGMIVSSFLPEILQVENIEVHGIYTRRIETARALCERYHIPLATDDLGTLFSSGIDTVYVAVSNIAHYEFCKAALQNGLHVIVEKPITANFDQAVELKNLANQKNLFLFEAITTIHMGPYHMVPYGMWKAFSPSDLPGWMPFCPVKSPRPLTTTRLAAA